MFAPKSPVKSALLSSSLIFFQISCDTSAHDRAERASTQALFTEQARHASTRPIRPGIANERPFWNQYAKRFIYAPAFDFQASPNVSGYRFTVTSKTNAKEVHFEAESPWASLAPIWADLPEDHYHLSVEALPAANDSTDKVIGERDFLKSTPFTGVKNEPAFPYRESGLRNLQFLLRDPKIQYWLQHRQPDPSYPLWCHSTKIMSALVIGLIHYAKYCPDAEDVDQALAITQIVVDFLLAMREGPEKPLAHWPPTYWDGIPRGDHPYFENEIMTNSPAIGAEMLLDLHEFTGEEDYFLAAKRIAETYVRTQREDGTWPQILHTETGEAVKKNLLVPTMVIELFDRFIEDHDLVEFQQPRQKAFTWCMTQPVKTFNWQAQFEDTRPQKQFKNLSREEPSEFARILFKASEKHPEYIELAEELLRFAEDQFIVWDDADPALTYPWFREDSKWNGTVRPDGHDWFVPAALEQYKFYTPIARSSQLMILAYLTAYEYTHKPIYHAKAVALANTLTNAQHFHGGGEIPTHLRKNLPELNWLNNGIYPAITLIEKADQLSKSAK